MAARWNKAAWISLLILALGAGIFWRQAHLDNRPLHADEAVQAWLTWQLLRGDGYHYDPLDRHGPSLYYGAAALQRLRGGDADNFDDVAARRFSLCFGIATLLLFAFVPRTVGASPWVGPTTVALLAFETFSTLYQTYFVQEATLAFLIWAFFFLLLAPRTRANWIALGAVAGLAQATKEIAPVYLLFAWAAVRLSQRPTRAPNRGDLIATLVAWTLPAVALYTSFGSHWTGLIDAFRTYVLQATRIADSAHHYPWWHLFELLGVLPTGGPSWGQTVLLILGTIGLGTGFLPRAKPLHRATALLSLSLLLLHTLSPYKTPWLLLTPMLGLTFVAAQGLVDLAGRFRFGVWVSTALATLAILQAVHVGRIALDRYPGDARNPYFYQQTPRPFLRLVDQINRTAATAAPQPLKIAVVSAEHAWPLPWYLRDQPTVGYFATPPSGLTTWDMVVQDSLLGSLHADTPSSAWAIDYVGLRPGVLLEVSTRQALWEATHFPATP